MSKFYLTTAIVYTNQEPHIGFALELLYADVIARYFRAQGEDVWFLTGTDEHGQKIAKAAKEHDVNPQKWTDTIAKRVQELTKAWNISHDDFIRTTESRHEQGAQAFWRAAMKNGDLYKKSYTALYCEGCESFKTAKDLVDNKCPDHQKKLEAVEEENYFFALSKYQKKIETLFKKQPDFVVPESKRNEMLNVLKDGLEDISVSRSTEHLQWGIPVPDDDTQVMYVWFDALTNYVTAL
ncbi:MAG: methionine--tRNA ligase, partial [Patescibacteria group bacterium]